MNSRGLTFVDCRCLILAECDASIPGHSPLLRLPPPQELLLARPGPPFAGKILIHITRALHKKAAILPPFVPILPGTAWCGHREVAVMYRRHGLVVGHE